MFRLSASVCLSIRTDSLRLGNVILIDELIKAAARLRQLQLQLQPSANWAHCLLHSTTSHRAPCSPLILTTNPEWALLYITTNGA